MLNATQVLTHLNIDLHLGTNKAVQEVGELIRSSDNPLGAARAIFDNLTPAGTKFEFDDSTEARMTVQNLVNDAITLGENYDPDQALKRAAEWVVNHKKNNPWSFVKPEGYSTIETTTVTKHDVAVQVKEDGKIKKGGKQVLAQALYVKNPTLDNKALIQLFMKELDMSEAGARTYVYNCRKAAKG